MKLNNQITAIVCCVVVGGSFLGLQYMKQSSIEKMAKEKQRQEEVAKLMKQIDIDKCYGETYDLYIKDWNSACELNGLKDNCSLPGYRADDLNKDRKDREAICIKRYN